MLLKFLTALLVIAEPKVQVKNAEIPRCKHCKFYIPPECTDYPELAECERFKYFDQRTGYSEFPYAKTCRNKEYMCGLQGKHFVFNKKLENTFNKNKA
tara:strand:+ start:365 stop:658 length:294 start_codon:yes stop_codon:yes gene_type:complete